MTYKVCIRADGSPEIGLGHIVRCISLAHMLKNEFSIHFYSKQMPEKLEDEIVHLGGIVKRIENEDDFISCLNGNEIVVLDGYQFDSEYQKRIKEKECKLVCIDDFHNQHFYADLVINHAPGVSKKDYSGESFTKYLLGPDHSLLRPEFLEKRINKEHFHLSKSNIFLCFGGSDSKNLTQKILSWLPDEDYIITIVIGNAYQHIDTLLEEVKKKIKVAINIKCSLSAEEMKAELEISELAIVPASGILFEVISIGVPVISGYYTNNQLCIYKGFVDLDVIFDAVDFTEEVFKSAYQNFKRSNPKYTLEKQNKIIDGNSGERILKSFEELW